ncbi:PASTA domain-containing protein [Nocardia sp. NPDC024068]|uniref:PASTA domain-containing protein n=1 Tax=Nocardia sp. NPDC024068 TaxID=3157197 RepID=UPI0033DDA708
MQRIAAYLAIAAALTATACGATETQTADVHTAVPPAQTTPVTAVPADRSEPAADLPGRSDSVAVPMPDVVCLNLQDAQDRIQAAGVFFSRSEDATGAGRRQIADRNWVVVGQNPAAGLPVGEGDAVLSVVKTGEPGDCS